MPLPPPSPSEPPWRSGPLFALPGVNKSLHVLGITQASEDDLERPPRTLIGLPEHSTEKPDTRVLSEEVRALLRRSR